MVKYIDLFSGIGSFHYSFRERGWECVMACDISKPARDTYKANYGIEPMGDIKKINPEDIEPYDILTSGNPCQSFSQIGNNKGLDDDRGNLFFEVLRFVRINRPKIVIFENVSNLLTHNNGRTFKAIKEKIEEEEYNIQYKVLKCSDYGIPQMRKRIFIICTRDDINVDSNLFDFDRFKRKVTLSNFLGMNFDKKDIAYTIRCGGRLSPINDRHNWDGYMVDGSEYRLTINDAKKLQGYDDAFILCGTDTEKWKLLGNTIPTIFTKMISDSIYNLID